MTPTPQGFEIALNIRAGMVWLRVWGPCDGECRKHLELAVRDKVLELSAQAQWDIRDALIDVSRVAPASDGAELAEDLRRVFVTSAGGVRKVAYVSADPLPRWSPTNGRASPQFQAFVNRETALEWLHE